MSTPGQSARTLAVALALAGCATSVGAQNAAADSAAALLVERTAAAYSTARNFRAQFTQTLLVPRSGHIERATGEFLQRGLSQFSFAFTEPAGDRIVADGDVLWIYVPSSAPGQVLRLPRAAGVSLDLATSLLRAPRERYVVRALGDTVHSSRPVHRIMLTPRADDAPFRTAELWIDPNDLTIRRLVIAEPLGLVRTIDFNAIEIGGVFSAGAFTFTPPEGVRVIDHAALLGGSVPPRKP